ncbi:hypothetical protein HU200_054065 [Digitaria exilis]|uniref:Retrotransposon Copia-like N-terminal domain-containing protein n=1 Tax=Digitaria exilis TaxID=1010633 RepID=A0A835AJF7_9POAL|nr:hypothetical protein HU200_054065 [Digitaria exilis]
MLKPAMENTAEDYSRLMATNLESCFHLSQLAHTLLLKATVAGGGSIVNISTIGSYIAFPGSYAALRGIYASTFSYMVSEPSFSILTSTMSSSSSPAPGLMLAAPEKLTRDNFLLWQAQVMPALRGAQLVGYLDCSIPAPPKTVVVIKEDTSTTKVDNPAYATWLAQEQQVLGYILGSLSRDVLAQVATLTSTVDVWATLNEMVIHLRSKLVTTRKGDMSASTYFSKMKGLADEMAAAGKPLDDEDVVTYILAGLDAEYNPLVEAISAWTDPVSLGDLYAQLLAAEARDAATATIVAVVDVAVEIRAAAMDLAVVALARWPLSPSPSEASPWCRQTLNITGDSAAAAATDSIPVDESIGATSPTDPLSPAHLITTRGAGVVPSESHHATPLDLPSEADLPGSSTVVPDQIVDSSTIAPAASTRPRTRLQNNIRKPKNFTDGTIR